MKKIKINSTMRLTSFVLIAFLSTNRALGETTCSLQEQVPADDQNRSLYLCKGIDKTFTARCDGSTDAELKTPPVPTAVWKKYGNNEGIEFAGNFVVCKISK